MRETRNVSADELVALLGHSIKSKELREIMKALGSNTNPRASIDVSGHKYEAESTNRKGDVTLTFDGYHRYLHEYGEPLFISDKATDELVLVQIELQTDRITLPFGLGLGDAATKVTEKLGKKPYEKSSVDYGHAWWFRFDEYRLLAALDRRLRLIWVRIFRLTSEEKAKAHLKKFLSKQNAKIKPESATSVLSARSKLPTIEWKRRQAEGDTSFTDAGIQATTKLLEGFLETLATHASNKKAANIYNSVKRVVVSLNQITTKHDQLIETLEREELCAFINEVVRATGLEVVGDVTEEWREW